MCKITLNVRRNFPGYSSILHLNCNSLFLIMSQGEQVRINVAHIHAVVTFLLMFYSLRFKATETVSTSSYIEIEFLKM